MQNTLNTQTKINLCLDKICLNKFELRFDEIDSSNWWIYLKIIYEYIYICWQRRQVEMGLGARPPSLQIV